MFGSSTPVEQEKLGGMPPGVDVLHRYSDHKWIVSRLPPQEIEYMVRGSGINALLSH